MAKISRLCAFALNSCPFKRAIQEQLLNPLASELLEGGFKAGDKIKVSAKGNELVFEKKK